MAVDILDTASGCGLESACFGSTTAGQWLADNAYRFGWVLRYPEDMTSITGYEYEPWHYRWVGTGLATDYKRTGLGTLEEYFSLDPATDYPA